MEEPQKVSLLVVDDEAPIRKLLARIAQRAGFDVDTARDGEQALEMFAAKSYAIAIVDLMMPRVSGYELVEKLGELRPRPVIIVATAMANSDVATLDDSLVRRVIRKPFDIHAVAEALVETARQAAELYDPPGSSPGVITVKTGDAATTPLPAKVDPAASNAEPHDRRPSEQSAGGAKNDGGPKPAAE